MPSCMRNPMSRAREAQCWWLDADSRIAQTFEPMLLRHMPPSGFTGGCGGACAVVESPRSYAMQSMRAPCAGRIVAARQTTPLAGLPATHAGLPLLRQRPQRRPCGRVQLRAVARGAGMGGDPEGGGGGERRRGRGGGPGGDSGFGGDRPPRQEDDGFQERVVQVRRVTKVVKGGKQLSFRAVVVVGDEKGSVGVGCAAAKEVLCPCILSHGPAILLRDIST